MPIRAVIFDLDGTLLDTLDEIVAAVNHVLAERGFPTHAREHLTPMIGHGVGNLFERALPSEQATPARIDECGQAYVRRYTAEQGRLTRPFVGITELLDAIVARGLPMAVLSNKAHPLTVGCVRQFLSSWRFEIVQGAEPGRPHKPDPAGALQIAAHLRVDPSEFAYLGDTPIDVQTAKAAGMRAIAATWGVRPREDLLDADELIADPRQMIPLLDR